MYTYMYILSMTLSIRGNPFYNEIRDKGKSARE